MFPNSIEGLSARDVITAIAEDPPQSSSTQIVRQRDAYGRLCRVWLETHPGDVEAGREEQKGLEAATSVPNLPPRNPPRHTEAEVRNVQRVWQARLEILRRFLPTEVVETLGAALFPWDVAEWMTEPNGQLEGRTPHDVWPVNRDAVLAAARQEHWFCRD